MLCVCFIALSVSQKTANRKVHESVFLSLTLRHRKTDIEVRIIIIITTIEFSLGDRSPYSITDNTNKNKYT